MPVRVSVQICGVWKNLAKPLMRQLQSEQLRISVSTSTSRREEVEGKIIKHRALFAGAWGTELSIHRAAELITSSCNPRKPRMGYRAAF